MDVDEQSTAQSLRRCRAAPSEGQWSTVWRRMAEAGTRRGTQVQRLVNARAQKGETFYLVIS